MSGVSSPGPDERRLAVRSRPRPGARDSLPGWRRAARYGLARAVLGVAVRLYLRPRARGRERLPTGPYVACFNHLSWIDPFLLFILWPPRPRVHIFGPQEEDMSVGLRNRIIGWSGTAVPFRPSRDDLLASTRRVAAVLGAGGMLAIAGEGRLSEEEGRVLPLNEGPAYFALRSHVPLVPVGVVGTRWLRFGKLVEARVGTPIETTGLPPDRETVNALTARLQGELAALVRDHPTEAAPGRFGRWMTDLFSERPWRVEEPGSQSRHPPAARRGS